MFRYIFYSKLINRFFTILVYMFNVSEVINNIRRVIGLPRTPIVTSAGIKMRSPFNHKGEWIGWTPEEVASHLSSMHQYKSNIPLKEPIKIPHKDYDRGCSRG
jgi:hypothetical protein